MRQDNIALMRRGYDAFTSGDLDTIRSMAHSDEVWVTPGMGEFKREYRGVDDVIGYLAQLVANTDGTFKDEPVAFFGDDEHVVVLEHVTAAREGRSLDSQFVHVYDMRDGKISRVTEYAADPHAVEAFWA